VKSRQSQQRPASRVSRYPAWLLTAFWISVMIALAAVLRRAIALAHPSPVAGPMPVASMDASFSSHAALTFAHIIPAAVFVVLAAAALFCSTRKWLDRLVFLFGGITGATAYAMLPYAIGGWIERSAVLVFDSWFLFSLGRACWYHFRHDDQRKRDWTTRAIGVLLGIATTRPVMGIFFATSAITHLGPEQFFGIAFWIGFSINAAGVELWLHSRRRAQVHQAEWGLWKTSSLATRTSA
jgi:hypothetical protein